jgi:hypothetical protein
MCIVEFAVVECPGVDAALMVEHGGESVKHVRKPL